MSGLSRRKEERLKVKTTTTATRRIEWTLIHIHCTYHLYTCHKAWADALNAATSSRYRARMLKWKSDAGPCSLDPAGVRPLPLNRFYCRSRIALAPSKCRVSHLNNKTSPPSFLPLKSSLQRHEDASQEFRFCRAIFMGESWPEWDTSSSWVFLVASCAAAPSPWKERCVSHCFIFNRSAAYYS